MGTKHQVGLYLLILEIMAWTLLEFFTYNTHCDIMKNYLTDL